MRYVLPLLSVCLAAAASAQSNLNPNPNTPPTGADTKTSPEAAILSELHAANLTEIQEGKLAADKASLGKTKSFGKMLVKDHTAADQLVKKEASRLNVTMSDTLPAAQQAEVDALSASGDFDASFARDEAAGHAKVIADAEAARKDVTDKEVKKLIGKLLPKLHKHEKDAERLEKAAKS